MATPAEGTTSPGSGAAARPDTMPFRRSGHSIRSIASRHRLWSPRSRRTVGSGARRAPPRSAGCARGRGRCGAGGRAGRGTSPRRPARRAGSPARGRRRFAPRRGGRQARTWSRTKPRRRSEGLHPVEARQRGGVVRSGARDGGHRGLILVGREQNLNINPPGRDRQVVSVTTFLLLRNSCLYDGFMQHNDIWRAIDALAAENGLSASGLARKAGLDPTAFNPSKRTGPDGRARWPSTESVAKVLAATGTGMDDFADLVTGAARCRPRPARRRIPLIGLAQAGPQRLLRRWRLPRRRRLGRDQPAGGRRPQRLRAGDQRRFDGAGVPRRRRHHRLARRPVRRGDRVVVRTRRGGHGEGAASPVRKRVELASLNPAHPNYSFDLEE